MAGIVAVVLAAGAGTRLQPLTYLLPKALCPIGNVPLVDLAVARARRHTDAIAVNVHHHRPLMQAHLGHRVRLSIEEPVVLGTAGALGALRDWIDGRDVLLLNTDIVHGDELDGFVSGWDRTRVRLLTVETGAPADFGTSRYAGTALLPWEAVRRFEAQPSGLYDTCFGPAMARNELDLYSSVLPFIDCGTISGYHSANMDRSGGGNVVGDGAIVEGEIESAVVWPDATVRRGERLRNAVRAGDGVTVFASPK